MRSFLRSTALPLLAAALALSAHAAPAQPRLSTGGGWWWLPFTLALALGSHLVIGRGLKAVIAAVRPLAQGSPEAAGYERGVYGSPAPIMHGVVGLVALSGVVLWLAIGLGHGLLVLLSLAVFAGALALDLTHWERASANADFVWFQRGLGRKIHQVAIENIRSVSVTEQTVGGFSVRHGRHNRVCRLSLRLHDKRVVGLPKTDSHGTRGADAVETLANHVRKRKALLADRTSPRRRTTAPMPLADGAPLPQPPADKDMLRALKRLRKESGSASPPAANGIGPKRPPTLLAEVPPQPTDRRVRA
ncbi:MAG: hypothetical protein RLZZ618_2287 [Pseudomonadota bacterium]|jgi:hypothetical protein